jgi:transposase InsO family protein
MDEKQKKEIAVFRYSVISDLVYFRPVGLQRRSDAIHVKASRRWDIPYSNRSTISASTIRRWLNRYLMDKDIKSLYPRDRADNGGCRAIDDETAAALIQVRKDYPDMPITMLIDMMDQRDMLPLKQIPSMSTFYRFFKKQVDLLRKAPKTDRRRFEAEFPNDIWQSDVMHGPKLRIEGKLRKTYLIAFIDDHSRLVPNAVFYLKENLDCFLSALKGALMTRGVPRKLYVDNGAAFRSNHLAYIAAALQINLIHAKPYSPQGKGKIERFFRTVRDGFLTEQLINEVSETSHPLMEFNEQFSVWLMDGYHQKNHSSTSQTPLERFKNGIEMVRAAPDNLQDYFRKAAMRTVTKDRVVYLNGKLFEAPVDLIGERIELLYHDGDNPDVEARFDGKSFGILKPVNPGINVKVKRAKYNAEITLETTVKHKGLQPGKLFDKKRRRT